MHEETTASLVSRVEHCALEAERGQVGKKSEVRPIVSEQYPDQGNFARQAPQGIAEAFEHSTFHGQLEVVDADRRQRSRPRENRFLGVGRIAERRTRLASPRDWL